MSDIARCVISEVSLATDWAALNPSPAEIEKLKQAGFAITEVSPKVYKRDTHTTKIVELPFYKRPRA